MQRSKERKRLLAGILVLAMVLSQISGLSGVKLKAEAAEAAPIPVTAPLIDHGATAETDTEINVAPSDYGIYIKNPALSGHDGSSTAASIEYAMTGTIPKHYNGNHIYAYWAGFAFEHTEGNTYYIAFGNDVTGVDITDAGKTVPTSTFIENGKTYDSFYIGSYTTLADKNLYFAIEKANEAPVFYSFDLSAIRTVCDIKDSDITIPTANDQRFDSTPLYLANPGSAESAHYEYRLSDNGSFSTSVPTAVSAGTYSVYYRLVPNTYYALPSNLSSSVRSGGFETTIEKEEVTINLQRTLAYIHAGDEISFDLGVNTAVYGKITSSGETALLRRFLEKQSTDYDAISSVSVDDGRVISLKMKYDRTDDGNIVFPLDGLALENATLSEGSSLLITLDSSRAVDISVNVPESSYTYTGFPVSGVTYTVSRNGEVISGVKPSLYYSGTLTDGTAYSSSSAPKEAGIYSVTASVNSETYSGQSDPSVFTILPARAYVTSLDINSSLYITPGENFPVITVQNIYGADITSLCDISYEKDGGNKRAYNLSGKTKTSDIGSYNVYIEADKNHSFSYTPSIYTAADSAGFTFYVRVQGSSTQEEKPGNTANTGYQNPSEYTNASTGDIIPERVYVPSSDGSGNRMTRRSDGRINVTSSVLGTADPASPAVFGEGKLYRMYNRNSGEHFYTKDPSERNALVAVGWDYEADPSGKKAVATTESGAIPVYRLFNPSAGLHHFTTDLNEARTLKSLGWRYEGIALYAYAASSGKGANVYRLYCPYPDPYGQNQHIYTTDLNEVNGLTAIGYVYEGIAWNIKN